MRKNVATCNIAVPSVIPKNVKVLSLLEACFDLIEDLIVDLISSPFLQ